MGLSAQNVAIVPTPSGVLDGHFPDGNDGTGAIPLTWAIVPSFLQKQVGTPFTVNVFTLYLTQPGAPAATATISVGALSGGWTLDSAGNLAYSGVGQGTGTVRVRATRLTATSDSNLFTFESIATIVSADTLPPTIPTNPNLISKTVNSATVSSDVPADVPTSLIPASGYKETRWFKEGVIDGTVSFAPGLLQRLTKLDVAASSGRRMPLGFLSTVSKSQRDNANGVPSYSVGPGITAVVIRYRWWELEPGAAGVYDFLSRMDNEVSQAQGFGVQFIAMIEVRTFDIAGGNRNPMPDYLVPYSSWFNSDDIATTTGTCTSGSKVITGVASMAGIVDGGGIRDSARTAIPYAARVQSHNSGANTITMDMAATQSGSKTITYGALPDGYQGWRWHPTVLLAYQNLVNAIGARYDNNPTYGTTFAGIATQETSNGGIATGVGGYTPTVYGDALISEDTYISNACPHGRHWYYFNFMSGSGTTAQLQRVANQFTTNATGAVVGFPDLGNSNSGMGNIVSSVYPIVQSYHNSGGYTFGAVQQSEWTANNHPSFPQLYMSELYNYGTSTGTYPTPGYPASVPDWSSGSPLKLDGIIYNVQQGNNGLGEQFSTTIIGTNGIARTNATPIGTLPAVSGTTMTTGSVTQTGTNYSVLSFGTGLNATNDQWTAASNSVNGNVTAIFKMASLTGTDTSSGAVMGACFRDAPGQTARAVYMVATATQLLIRQRIGLGSAASTIVAVNSQGWNVPKWGKITRAANLFSFFYSTDGLTWTAAGTTTLALVPTIYFQLFAGTTGTSSVTGNFQQVNVQQLATQNYTFSGLTLGLTYHFTAVGRDLANNDSAVSATLTVTI